MNKSQKYTFVVTGAGVLIGCGITKSLRMTSEQLFVTGADMNSQAVAQNWRGSLECIPAAKEPK